jgi:hemin uptake protein HemP
MTTSSDSRDERKKGGATHPAERGIVLSDNSLKSSDLFATAREITISHGEEVYRLRLTSQNKLILTK